MFGKVIAHFAKQSYPLIVISFTLTCLLLLNFRLLVIYRAIKFINAPNHFWFLLQL